MCTELRLACIIALAGLLMVGCEAGVCARHSDCSFGQICAPSGTCIAAPDAGPDVDGGGPDAGDAGDVIVPDAALPDGGPGDGGPRDGGIGDAGPSDAGTADAEHVPVGTTDASQDGG